MGVQLYRQRVRAGRTTRAFVGNKQFPGGIRANAGIIEKVVDIKRPLQHVVGMTSQYARDLTFRLSREGAEYARQQWKRAVWAANTALNRRYLSGQVDQAIRRLGRRVSRGAGLELPGPLARGRSQPMQFRRYTSQETPAGIRFAAATTLTDLLAGSPKTVVKPHWWSRAATAKIRVRRLEVPLYRQLRTLAGRDTRHLAESAATASRPLTPSEQQALQLAARRVRISMRTPRTGRAYTEAELFGRPRVPSVARKPPGILTERAHGYSYRQLAQMDEAAARFLAEHPEFKRRKMFG